MRNDQYQFIDQSEESLNEAVVRLREDVRARMGDEGWKGVEARMTEVLVEYAHAVYEERRRRTEPREEYAGVIALIACILGSVCEACITPEARAEAVRLGADRVRELALAGISVPSGDE